MPLKPPWESHSRLTVPVSCDKSCHSQYRMAPNQLGTQWTNADYVQITFHHSTTAMARGRRYKRNGRFADTGQAANLSFEISREMGMSLRLGKNACWTPLNLCSKMCVTSAIKRNKREHSGQERRSEKPHKTSLPYTYRQKTTLPHKPPKIMANEQVAAGRSNSLNSKVPTTPFSNDIETLVTFDRQDKIEMSGPR